MDKVGKKLIVNSFKRYGCRLNQVYCMRAWRYHLGR